MRYPYSGGVSQGNSTNRTTAGVIALATSLTGFASWAGIHKFLMGYTKEGIIWIVASLFTCGLFGFVMGLIEGIIYLTMTDAEFESRYVYGSKPWL